MALPTQRSLRGGDGLGDNRQVTPERLMLDTLERVGRLREGRLAVHIHLSRLRPENREDAHLRIAVRLLDPLASGYRCQLFVLSNNDIVILGRDVPYEDVDATLRKLRSLFGKDPLTREDAGDGRDQFATIYDLERDDYDAYLTIAQEMLLAAERRQNSQAAASVAREPLTAMMLDAVVGALDKVDMTGFVRRQSAVHVAGPKAEVVFQEFFFAMPDLQRAVAPNVTLTSNHWLFRHLSAVLDKLMITAVARMRVRQRPLGISLNLNVNTLAQPQFQAFVEGLPPGQLLVVEIEPVDAFAHFAAFSEARDQLRAKGHKIALDRVTPLTLELVDLALFDADYLKLIWSPDLADHAQAGQEREMIAAAGPERCILSRCDSEAAVSWGLEMGIVWFQGRFVDAMMSAVTMAVCTEAGKCTLAQCVARRAVIAGPERAECTNHDRLDFLPPIMSPRRRQ